MEDGRKLSENLTQCSPSLCVSSQNNILEKGEVDFLEIANGSYVKVHVKSDSYLGMHKEPGDGSAPFYFTIGSVDTFEKKLEEAQKVQW